LNNILSPKNKLDELKNHLIDPLAKELANTVKWNYLNGISQDENELYPVAVLGEGPPILMLHGFDSCFLEFRRIAPLLKKKYTLIIPDLYGFGFCPRPTKFNYEYQKLISHLSEILKIYAKNRLSGVIGASMGGSVAMELARNNPEKINQLLLLSPAGISSLTKKIPWPLNEFGVSFLRQSFVRKSLCRQAFANPSKSVGKAEEQIASLHLNVPGWQKSMAEFAKSGGISDFGNPLPAQPIEVLWGAQDRIIKQNERKKSMIILGKKLNEINNCGHLPHLDTPKFVADFWQKLNKNKPENIPK
tara:strand:+ start:23 stop:931 length:909 start_codon:yes stop_codon:yes gene_type:complete